MNYEAERRPGKAIVLVLFLALLLAVVIFGLGMAALFGKPAHAHPSERYSTATVTTVTVADLVSQPLAVAATTAARPGEGVIRITTRVCGNANNWESVAATNRGVRLGC